MCQNQRCKISVLRAMLPETGGESPSLSPLALCWQQSVRGIPDFGSYITPVSIIALSLP